jgi:hypothetical protein
MRLLAGRRRRRTDPGSAPDAGAAAEPAAVEEPPAPDPFAAAAQAESEGRLVEAVDLLRDAIKGDPAHDPALEAHLVALRHLAFDEVAGGTGRSEWPPTFADRTPAAPEPPRIGPAELGADVLGSALVNHGALHVEGLLTPEQVTSMVEGIDRAFDGRDAWGEDKAADTAPWFVPFVPSGPYSHLMLPRDWVRDGGGVWAADSPRVFSEMLAIFEGLGLDHVIGGYLGERPAISMRKCTLRRVPADLAHADWHQDGAFLGDGVRSVNVWLALTRCGGDSDAPGLEYVPRRIDHVVETGTHGATFDWSVGPGHVDEVAAELGSAIVRPQFEAGDALLFDDVFLHRTAVAPGLGTDRYAIESWFFAPSTYPSDQIPLVF